MTLCGPMDCSLSGSSVHGILQARILDWSGYPFPSQGNLPKLGIESVSYIAGRFFTVLSNRWIQIQSYCDLCQSVPPVFSSKRFIVSGPALRPLDHFEFIFVCDIRECSNFIILHVPV